MEQRIKANAEEIEELTKQLEVHFLKLKQHTDDIETLDEQYREVYKLNHRYRTKLETRVSELDETKTALCDTKHKLDSYSSAFKYMHSQAKTFFRELQQASCSKYLYTPNF